MRYYSPDLIRMYESATIKWKLMYSIESAAGSVREYQAKSPIPGRMYQLRIRENALGSYGSYSVTR